MARECRITPRFGTTREVDAYMERRPHEKFHPYRCEECGGWHVLKRPVVHGEASYGERRGK